MQCDDDGLLFAELAEACDPFVQPFAGDELHDGEIFVVVIAGVEACGDEFGILEMRGDACFVEQRQNIGRIRPFVTREDFHGEKAAWIFGRDGLVDGSHAAAAGRFEEIVVLYFLRCEETGMAFGAFVELHESERAQRNVMAAFGAGQPALLPMFF